jgi:hypothetical protein
MKDIDESEPKVLQPFEFTRQACSVCGKELKKHKKTSRRIVYSYKDKAVFDLYFCSKFCLDVRHVRGTVAIAMEENIAMVTLFKILQERELEERELTGDEKDSINDHFWEHFNQKLKTEKDYDIEKDI